MQPVLTNYQIKVLAALLMVIDHVGVVFFPDVSIFRIIGRLSFPLFAWLLVEGEAHTRSVWQYALRLLVLGIVSQFVYVLILTKDQFNILFTLLLGLLCLRAARLLPRFQGLVWVGGAVLATIANIEYWAYGIATIALVRQFKPEKLWWWAGWILLHLVLLFALPNTGEFQFPAVYSPLLFLLANHQQGARARWFYLFYPLHLLVLFLVRLWLNSRGVGELDLL